VTRFFRDSVRLSRPMSEALTPCEIQTARRIRWASLKQFPSYAVTRKHLHLDLTRPLPETQSRSETSRSSEFEGIARKAARVSSRPTLVGRFRLDLAFQIGASNFSTRRRREWGALNDSRCLSVPPLVQFRASRYAVSADGTPSNKRIFGCVAIFLVRRDRIRAAASDFLGGGCRLPGDSPFTTITRLSSRISASLKKRAQQYPALRKIRTRTIARSTRVLVDSSGTQLLPSVAAGEAFALIARK